MPCCSQPVSDRAFAAAQLHSKRLVKLDTQYLGSSIISAGGFCLSSLRPYLLVTLCLGTASPDSPHGLGQQRVRASLAASASCLSPVYAYLCPSALFHWLTAAAGVAKHPLQSAA